jgi:hypothetical protein
LETLSGATTISYAKLVFLSIDGKNIMVGCHHGVVIRLNQAAKFPVLRIWCMPHEIDIVIKNIVTLPQDG